MCEVTGNMEKVLAWEGTEKSDSWSGTCWEDILEQKSISWQLREKMVPQMCMVEDLKSLSQKKWPEPSGEYTILDSGDDWQNGLYFSFQIPLCFLNFVND